MRTNVVVAARTRVEPEIIGEARENCEKLPSEERNGKETGIRVVKWGYVIMVDLKLRIREISAGTNWGGSV